MPREVKPLSRGFIKSVEALEKTEKKQEAEISFDKVGVYNGRLYKKSSIKYRFLSSLSSFFGLRETKVYREMNLLTKLSRLASSNDVKIPLKTRECAKRILKSGTMNLFEEMKSHPARYSYWNIHHVYQILEANSQLMGEGSLEQLQNEVMDLFKTKIKASSHGENLIAAFNSINSFKGDLKQKAQAELVPLLYDHLKQKLNSQNFQSHITFIKNLESYYPDKSRLGLVIEFFAGRGNVQRMEGEGDDRKEVYGPADPKDFTEDSAKAFKMGFPRGFWSNSGFQMKKGDLSLSQSSCEKLLGCLYSGVQESSYEYRALIHYSEVRLKVNKNVDLQPVNSNNNALPPTWLNKLLEVQMAKFISKPSIVYSISVNESRSEEDRFLIIRKEGDRIVITLEPLE